MTTQPPDRLFRPVSPAAQAKGERVFCAAVALLLVLSEVFSSNIQNTLPTFSHVCRIALTVTAAVLLLAKNLLLTQWQTKQQALTAAALAAPALVGLGRPGCPGSLHAAGARLPRGRHCHGTAAGFVFAAACPARLF